MGSSRTGALQPGLEDAAAMRGNLDVVSAKQSSVGHEGPC